jgi:hypothetical protein
MLERVTLNVRRVREASKVRRKNKGMQHWRMHCMTIMSRWERRANTPSFAVWTDAIGVAFCFVCWNLAVISLYILRLGRVVTDATFFSGLIFWDLIFEKEKNMGKKNQGRIITREHSSSL